MRRHGLATMRVLAASATALSLVGCQAMNPEPPPPGQEEPGFVWLQAGRLANGCPYYIKKPRQPGTVVDQALWFRRIDGSMTTNARECAPP